MDPIEEAVVVQALVNAPAQAVYAFARRMDHLPRWASGLASGIAQRDGHWVAQSPMGEVTVAMAPENPFGVLDHDVTLPDGTTVHNALRVTPCGARSLLVFVVLRTQGMDQARFDADIAHVQKDLQALARLMDTRT